jgi:hypothetical protein
VSSPVTETAVLDVHKTPANTGEKSLPVGIGHSLSRVGGWCALQVSNLRNVNMFSGSADLEIGDTADLGVFGSLFSVESISPFMDQRSLSSGLARLWQLGWVYNYF